MKKREFFKIEGDRVVRSRRHCPKCGPGVFLAEHNNRFSCGNCGYTEFKSGGKRQQSAEKPVKKESEPKTEKQPSEEEKKSEQMTSEESEGETEEPKKNESESEKSEPVKTE